MLHYYFAGEGELEYARSMRAISFCCQNDSKMAEKTIFDKRYVKFVSELVKIRHSKGWSQRDLAKRVGVNHNFIARIEIRDRRLDLIEVIDYMKALGLSKAEIIKKISELI